MKTKRTILFMAIAIVLMISGISCSTSESGKYYCWELTFSDGETMYIWNTEDYVEYVRVKYANDMEGVTFTIKKSTKYKTLDDCVAKGSCYSSPWG